MPQMLSCDLSIRSSVHLLIQIIMSNEIEQTPLAKQKQPCDTTKTTPPLHEAFPEAWFVSQRRTKDNFQNEFTVIIFYLLCINFIKIIMKANNFYKCGAHS